MSTLHVDASTAELGWTLCFAIPVARYLAEPYDEVIVVGRCGDDFLWTDFADVYHGIRVEPLNFIEGRKLEEAPPPPPGADLLTGASLWQRFGRREVRWLRNRPGGREAPKVWRQYIETGPRIADVLVAFRGPKDGAEWKEYPKDQADRVVALLAAKGLTAAAIGGRDNYRPEGTIDARGISWPALTAGIRQARAVIGPSSGPLHFATLARARRVVTWFAGPDDTIAGRYLEKWNPFAADVVWVGTFGQHPAPEVVAAIAAAP